MTRRAIYLLLAALAVLAVSATLTTLWLLDTGGHAAPSGQIEPAFEAGPFRLGLGLSPETPRVGDNVLTVALRDLRGQPVRGASIGALAEMPAMGAMPAMQAPADMREIEPGLYRGTFAPAMAGSWPLTLEIAKDGLGVIRVSFDLATGREGFRLASGAVPLDRNETGALAGDAGAMLGASGTPDRRQESEAERTASFRVDSGWQQAIGVRTAPVGPRELTATLRLPGRVTGDETGLVDVNLRTAGWIERLLVEETGQYVAAGQKLLDLYSPELVTAQRDLLLAIDSVRQLVDSPSAEARERTAALVEASRRRLLRLGLTSGQVEEIVEGGELHETVPILSPSNGYVLEKMAVEGMRVEPGMRLFRIADLSTVWVLADVYEGDAGFAQAGIEAVFRLAYAPERSWRGRVDYVYPTLDAASRSIRVRFVFPNKGLELRPEMYGDVVLRQTTSAALAIPSEAVLDLGTRRVVFVDLGQGRLQAREVALGPEAGGWYPVRAGLSVGELVVLSGNFLIDAESKVRGVVPLPLDDEDAASSTGTEASDRATNDRR